MKRPLWTLVFAAALSLPAGAQQPGAGVHPISGRVFASVMGPAGRRVVAKARCKLESLLPV